jgi:hypothetical protein
MRSEGVGGAEMGTPPTVGLATTPGVLGGIVWVMNQQIWGKYELDSRGLVSRKEGTQRPALCRFLSSRGPRAGIR